MKNLIASFLFIMLSCAIVLAQPSKAYDSAMKRALSQMKTAETPAELQRVGNQFERIAKQTKTEWLPYYYQALSLTLRSFSDQTKADALADQAQEVLDVATPLAKTPTDKSELATLQGMVYTAKLIVDPMNRGQSMGALSAKSYGLALGLEPTNPRARLMSIRNQIGAAQFFKKDITAYVASAKQLYQDWDNYKPTGAMYPKWGKDQAKEISEMKTKADVSDNVKNKFAEANTSPVEVMEEASPFDATYAVTLTINLRSSDGVVFVSLKDENEKEVKSIKLTISDKQATTTFRDLKPGKYGVSYFHDENNNGKMDKGMFGIPKEGFGYSNDARGNMGPPKFEKTLFEVKENMAIVTKTMYM